MHFKTPAQYKGDILNSNERSEFCNLLFIFKSFPLPAPCSQTLRLIVISRKRIRDLWIQKPKIVPRNLNWKGTGVSQSSSTVTTSLWCPKTTYKNIRYTNVTSEICPINPFFHNTKRDYLKCDNADCKFEVDGPDCWCSKYLNAQENWSSLECFFHINRLVDQCEAGPHVQGQAWMAHDFCNWFHDHLQDKPAYKLMLYFAVMDIVDVMRHFFLEGMSD